VVVGGGTGVMVPQKRVFWPFNVWFYRTQQGGNPQNPFNPKLKKDEGEKLPLTMSIREKRTSVSVRFWAGRKTSMGFISMCKKNQKAFGEWEIPSKQIPPSGTGKRGDQVVEQNLGLGP